MTTPKIEPQTRRHEVEGKGGTTSGEHSTDKVARERNEGELLVSEIEERIALLKNEAMEAGDPFNAPSERDFVHFVNSHHQLRRPSIFLVDNGNLRAVWKNAAGLHLGLQFLGGAQVQFVIFAKRSDATDVVRSAGRDTLKGIERQITSFDLAELVYA
jgi:hypothetical protein